jgi:hypothetical protein
MWPTKLDRVHASCRSRHSRNSTPCAPSWAPVLQAQVNRHLCSSNSARGALKYITSTWRARKRQRRITWTEFLSFWQTNGPSGSAVKRASRPSPASRKSLPSVAGARKRLGLRHAFSWAASLQRELVHSFILFIIGKKKKEQPL